MPQAVPSIWILGAGSDPSAAIGIPSGSIGRVLGHAFEEILEEKFSGAAEGDLCTLLPGTRQQGWDTRCGDTKIQSFVGKETKGDYADEVTVLGEQPSSAIAMPNTRIGLNQVRTSKMPLFRDDSGGFGEVGATGEADGCDLHADLDGVLVCAQCRSTR